MANRPIGAFILGLVGGLFVLLNALLLLIIGDILLMLLTAFSGTESAQAMISTLMIVGMVLALALIAGSALLLAKPDMHKLWGLLILACSIAALFIGGGFFLGTILGAVAGLMAILWKGQPTAAHA